MIATDGIPVELRERLQWVCWRYEERDGKATKPPYTIVGKHASSTDPATWSTFEEALAASRDGDWNGIGFVFSGDDPFAGVDLDKCRNPVTGEIDPKAREIIDSLNSYSEVSPSSTGLHVIVKGKLPASGRKRGDLEMYDSGRYFCVTGEHLEGTPLTIEERGSELGALYQRFFANPKAEPSPPTPPPASLDDAELLERAQGAKNGVKFSALWRGDTAGYPSESEADAALCSLLAFWTGHDERRIDRLFRQSGLYREKWDTRRGDRTYGARTIERALGLTSETYTSRAPSSGNGASPAEPKGMSPTGDTEEAIHESDLGNSTRLVQQHGADLRYCFPQTRWYAWDGGRWDRDDTGEVHRRAKETVRSIYLEAAQAEGGRSKELARHALRSEAEARIAAMVALARSEPGVPVRSEELDADPWALNVLNGTVDLRSGELRPHRREDLISKVAPVEFDPEAGCPTFIMFLNRVMDRNADLIGFLQRAAGYSLTGDVSEQALFLMHGVGANGKSTFLDTLLALLGDYGKQAAPGLLMVKRGDRHPTEIADLAAARMVASVEVDEGRRLAEALVKWLTGGDRVKARLMRQDFFEFAPTHKLWLASNHRPTIIGTDLAVWRRIRLIPFGVVIPTAEQDRSLPAKLKGELPGVLNWALEGCLQWQRGGLNPPGEVLSATDQYRAEQDIIAAFLEDCCRLGANEKVAARALYNVYRQWCQDNGEDAMPQRRFGGRLKDRGLSGGHREDHSGRMWWHGAGLLNQLRADLDTG